MNKALLMAGGNPLAKGNLSVYADGSVSTSIVDNTGTTFAVNASNSEVWLTVKFPVQVPYMTNSVPYAIKNANSVHSGRIVKISPIDSSKPVYIGISGK